MADRLDDRFAEVVLPREFGSRERIDVVGIYRDPEPIASLVAELAASRHDVRFRLGAMGDTHPSLAAFTAGEQMRAGKFQNLDALIAAAGDDSADWLLLVDDDVTVGAGFLDRMIEVCRRLDLALAQPAQTRFSNANWRIATRHFLSVARETRFVEIGPITLLRRDAASVLVPFPADLRYGWGLDFRWSYLMAERGLRMGVVDALPATHASRAVASTYSWDAAQAEGRAFLAKVERAPVSVAQGRGIRTHRRLPRLQR